MASGTIANVGHSTESVQKDLRESSSLVIEVVGRRGCGKSTFIEMAINRMMRRVRAGAIAGDPEHVSIALRRLHPPFDILFFEMTGETKGEANAELCRNMTLAIVSADRSDISDVDRNEEAERIRGADVMVLNKIDLLGNAPAADSIRARMRRLNPQAVVFELSSLTGQGVDALVNWLMAESHERKCHASNWFG